MTKNLKISLIISVLFLGLIRFQPIWERHPGGFWNVLFFLSIVILFFWLITKIIKEIIQLIRQRKNLTFKLFIPLMILTIALFDGMFNPFKINLESIYGQVIFRACYEGTQNQATFYLRDNGGFDIHSTGVFFSDNFYTGKYKRYNDTIILSFDTEVPRLFGDTLLVKDDNLFVIKPDTILPTHFYLGYCKGLN